MMKYIAILGRQPEIGLAELESLYGSEAISPIHRTAAEISSDVDFARLGGTIKLAKYLTTLPTTDWQKIEEHLLSTVVEHEKYVPDGKLTIGISVYGIGVKPQTIGRTSLQLKKELKATGRSVRVVPNNAAELSSAQVIHNKLTGDNGWELILVRKGKETLLGLTTNIQDIEAYASRDQARPARDAKVGMLPPKLAQIIINLAGTHSVNPSGLPPASQEITNTEQKAPIATLLDPFCGTGVVLQEALLLGYEVLGTDLEPRMVDYSKTNLEWLTAELTMAGSFKLSVGDATTTQWPDFDVIACETYLGRPFSAEPNQQVLGQVMQDVDTIHRKFLKNVAKQTQPGFRMCIAVPAWNIRGRFKHLNMLDSLEELGYTRVSFAHTSNEELIYHRAGQVVGRELVVLIRK